jgi:uncharacterized damage-inducible protein DinB
MTIDEIRDLVAYTEWATARLTDAMRKVPDAARHRRDDSAFGSLHGTFAHLIAAEWVWVERWNGRSPTTPPEWVGVSSFDELTTRLDTVQRDRAAVIARLDDAALTAPIAYRTFAGVESANTIGELIRHVVNHGTYHRGQISMRLRQLGEQPPSTDYILWLRLPAPRVPTT